MVKELNYFWNGYKIPARELMVDTDMLQSILIYITSRLNYPQILTEISILEEFLPDAIQLSCRSLYQVMLKASCEYLLEFDEAKAAERLQE